MKKIILSLMAAFLMSNVAMAQENEKKERKQLSQIEMIQQCTEGMVKKFGLNEEQKEKLLQLNTEFAGKLPGRNFNRSQREPRRQFDRQNQVRPDSLRMRPRNMERPNMQEIRKNVEAYDAKLKTILNEEQFKAYQQERADMMKRRPERR